MIQVDLSKCTGCRRCEAACAFFHTGRINPMLARIKVIHLYDNGIDGPVVCRQCQERYCLKCPEKALSLGSQGEVICSPTVCNLCGVCEKACPIGAIEIFSDFVYICDLCGGDPKCIPACTEGALRYVPEAQGGSLAEVRKETQGQTPVQKRESWLRKSGRKLRENWENPDA
jgi:Fe-S-cluster-containing hydrogenase component 2